MAIRPLITAWAHVRVMLKRRILAQVLLEEIGDIERLLPRGHSDLDRRALGAPRPRFIVQYPAHYVTYFDAEVARLVRRYMDALEDYAAELATDRDTWQRASSGKARLAEDADSEDLFWTRVHRLEQAGDTLRTTLQELAGKRTTKKLLQEYYDAAATS